MWTRLLNHGVSSIDCDSRQARDRTLIIGRSTPCKVLLMSSITFYRLVQQVSESQMLRMQTVMKLTSHLVGDIKPTPRAVRNTFGDLRSQAFKNAGGKAPATPSVRKPSAASNSNKRKIATNDAEDDNESEKPEIKKNKDSHILNPKQFKNRLSANKPRTGKKARTSSGDEDELSSAPSSDLEDDTNDQVTSADRRSSARQTKSTTNYIQVDGNSSEDEKSHGNQDQDNDSDDDGDFDPAAHRQAMKKERGEKSVKAAVEMSWKDIEI